MWKIWIGLGTFSVVIANVVHATSPEAQAFLSSDHSNVDGIDRLKLIAYGIITLPAQAIAAIFGHP